MKIEETKLFCAFCGSPDEELTYSVYYDKLTRREIADVFCNSCGRAFLIIAIEEECEEKEGK